VSNSLFFILSAGKRGRPEPVRELTGGEWQLSFSPLISTGRAISLLAGRIKILCLKKLKISKKKEPTPERITIATEKKFSNA
jgi:hypothetical protein